MLGSSGRREQVSKTGLLQAAVVAIDRCHYLSRSVSTVRYPDLLLSVGVDVRSGLIYRGTWKYRLASDFITQQNSDVPDRQTQYRGKKTGAVRYCRAPRAEPKVTGRYRKFRTHPASLPNYSGTGIL